MLKIAALVPAFNEEKNIAELVRGCKPWADIVLVVDDGSKDRTAELAKAAGAEVVKHGSNRGKGEGLRTGFTALEKRAEFVVIMDADMQYEPREALKVLEPLIEGKADVVMGSRDWSKVPLRHRLGNWVWKTDFNLMFGTHLSDTNCGLIAVRESVSSKLNFHGGYIIENGMLADAVKNGLRVANVPVIVRYNHKSGFLRGVRMVAGILFFITHEGLKWRLKRG
ncbi:MAG: glycosyltransferase family 2 protein [Candidatus Aenigmatarchaeota archaeon]